MDIPHLHLDPRDRTAVQPARDAGAIVSCRCTDPDGHAIEIFGLPV